jgi:hypothetical protein
LFSGNAIAPYEHNSLKQEGIMVATIPPEHVALWSRIEAFSLDEPAVAFPFSARLARENGWNKAYTQRVIEEYKRFVLLAMIAGHPVTPSVAVDEAWHLHLTYTRSYWDAFCAQVLQRPLHHDPTRGGTAEGEKFVDWYSKTMDSYTAIFGQAPPTDIWPDAATRFAPPPRNPAARSDTHWVIPKPRVPQQVLLVLALLSLLFIPGCTGQGLSGPWLLMGGATLLIVIVAVMANIATRSARKGANNGGSGCGGGVSGGDTGGDSGGDGGGDGGGGCGGGCGGS